MSAIKFIRLFTLQVDTKKTAYQFTSVAEQRTSTIAIVDYICDYRTQGGQYKYLNRENFFYLKGKLFSWLNLNLCTKAESYLDVNLKWIFILNNYFKILKMFENR